MCARRKSMKYELYKLLTLWHMYPSSNLNYDIDQCGFLIR